MEIYEYDENVNWYILQVYMGCELSIQEKILAKAEKSGYKDRIKQVLCPYDEIISISPKGKQTLLNKAVYPGYVFIAIDKLDTLIWSEIQGLPKVSKFIGEKNKPTIMSKKEILNVLHKENNKNKNEKKYRVQFVKGDRIRVIAGSFENFEGKVTNFDPENNELVADIKVFGRETPTTLKITDVTLVTD